MSNVKMVGNFQIAVKNLKISLIAVTCLLLCALPLMSELYREQLECKQIGISACPFRRRLASNFMKGLQPVMTTFCRPFSHVSCENQTCLVCQLPSTTPSEVSFPTFQQKQHVVHPSSKSCAANVCMI